MFEQLEALYQEAVTALEPITTSDALHTWSGQYFGTKTKTGAVIELLRGVGGLPKEQRADFGKRANEIKVALETALAARAELIRQRELMSEFEAGQIDITLPGRPRQQGGLHPATQTLRQFADIWAEMGFQVFQSREVEDDTTNFSLLNIPEHHPARDMWDTFHTTTPGVLLRTHTSPGQIHAMRALGKEGTQPIRVILPGMCYRYEQVSARKEIQFNQVEGIAIGRNIRLTDLKGTIFEFLRRLYGDDVKVRFRSSYFPFTEPSMEVDVQAASIGKMGWLEVAGCGMIHPIVLQNGGYDPSVWSGFAFGFGPERLAMLKHNIQDIRYFWRNDLRFLEQF
jgi:phenylalanyl-tRNA synthetase alpha chain